MSTIWIQLVYEGFTPSLPSGATIGDDVTIPLSNGGTADIGVPIWTSVNGTSPTNGIIGYYQFWYGQVLTTQPNITTLTATADTPEGIYSTTYPSYIALNIPNGTAFSPADDVSASRIGVNTTIAAPGSNVTVSFQVANGGPDSFPVDVGIYLSPDPTITTGDQLLAALPVFLSPHEAIFYSNVIVNLPSNLGSGTYYVGVIPNFDNRITDPNSGNNASGGAPITIPGAATSNGPQSIGRLDFNGDSKADTLWRQSTTELLAMWLMNGSQIASSNYVTYQGAATAPDATWNVIDIGDFNADGKTDILWQQSTSGLLVDWTMNSSTISSSNAVTFQGAVVAPDSSWSLVGTGDFNADGKADTLWRQSSTGSLAEWLMNGSTIGSSNAITLQGNAVAPNSSWSVAATGDFNADGKTDILWRSSTQQLAEWFMNGASITSTASPSFQGTAVSPDSTWRVVGTGDFNGDGSADILWRQSTTEALAMWLMNGSTITAAAAPTFQTGSPITPLGGGGSTSGGTVVTPDSTWNVVELGDFNGDGKTDILWQQSTTGQLIDWTMNGSSIAASNNVTAAGNAVAPNSTWAVQGFHVVSG